MTCAVRVPHSCAICESTSTDVMYEPWVIENDPAKLYSAASGIPGTQRLVRCRDCGLIYETPRFRATEVVKGYEASNDAGHDSQHAMRVRSFYQQLKKLARHVPGPGAKVLDIGTAGGAFLEAAQQFGYEAWGMEPSRYLAEHGKARGLRVEQGTIEHHSFPSASFDMVTLWDVIEHLSDPREALLEIRRLLKPDGVLLINYPDIGTWQARLAGKRFWWLISNHLHHFTPKTIADICRRTGLEVFHFQSYWQTLEFGYLEGMAAHFKVPLAGLITKLTPAAIKRIPLPYYASQTTALARLRSTS